MHMHYACDVTGRPDMKKLQEVVILNENVGIITWWHELGLELVSDKVLAVIKADNPTSTTACCYVMFNKWLERTPDASWSRLVTALRKIKLYTAADVVIEHLKSGKYFLCIHNIKS